MGNNRVVVIALTLVLGLSPLSAHAEAEDDLFDTKAATEHLEKGLTELKAKNYDAAVEEFEESASIAPEAEAFYYLGYAYYLKGRAGDAESRKLSLENFDKAYELDPNFSPTRFKPAEPAPEREAGMEQESETGPAVTEQSPPVPPAAEQGAPSPESPAPEQAAPADQQQQ